MDNLQIIKILNPLQKNIRDYHIIAFESLTVDKLKEKFIPKDLDVIISINGKTIPENIYSNFYLQKGDCIVFTPRIQGDNMQILKSIIMLAITIVAMVYAPELGFEVGSMWYYVFVTAATMVGGFVVNALIPPPSPKFNMNLPTLDKGGLDTSQSYSWSPHTLQQQGLVVPRIYGTVKTWGNIISTYIENVNDKNYMNLLIALGQGPISRLYDFKINNQPKENYDGLEIHTRYGNIDQEIIPNFNDTKTEYPKSIEFRYDYEAGQTPIILTTSGNAFDALEVDVTLPQGLWQLNPSTGDLMDMLVQFKIEIKKQGADDWIAITHSMGWVAHEYSDSIWIAGHWAYTGPIWHTENDFGQGLTDPSLHTEGQVFEDNYNWVWHWIVTSQTSAYNWVVGHNTGDGGFVTILITGDTNYGSHQEGDPYGDGQNYWYWMYTLLPQQNGYWVVGYWNEDELSFFQVEVDGTDPNDHYEGEPYGDGVNNWYWIVHTWVVYEWEETDFAIIRDHKNTPIIRTYRADNLEYGHYDIKTTRWVQNCNDPKIGDITYITAVREVLYDDFIYPKTILVGIKSLATAKISGSIDFNCMCDGSLVRVYSAGVWSIIFSNNPAWVVWDILTQPVFDNDLNIVRYDGINPSRLDLDKFVEWANWCDVDTVPDGRGGTEKRITFNGIFDVELSMWEAALQVCQIGRACLIWNGSKITVAIDKPETPVQMFTVGNIYIDSFSETFLPMDDRASEIEMGFINSEKDYERDKFVIFNPNWDGKTTKVNLDLFGITKPSEAWRAGMYRLYCNQYLTRSVEFDADIDSIVCTIGDLIYLQHDIPQWGYGGRIVNVVGNVITLDTEVLMENNESYKIIIRLQDDTLRERNVVYNEGVHSEITVTVPFIGEPGPLPQLYDIYAFGRTDILVKPFRVINLKRSGDQKCTISAIEYNETIYNVDTDQPVLPTPDYSGLDLLPSVRNLTLDELWIISSQGLRARSVIDIYYNLPVNHMFSHGEIWYKYDGPGGGQGGWIFAGVSQVGYFRITGIVEVGQLYTIAVVTVNFLGQKQSIEKAPKAQIYTRGKLDPPSNVKNFTAYQNGQYVIFHWDHIEDADLAGYELRQGVNWITARVIASNISDNRYNWDAEMDGTFKFMIKVRDTSGLFSDVETYVILTLEGIEDHLNIILQQDEIKKTGGPDGYVENFVYISGEYMVMPDNLIDTDVPAYKDSDNYWDEYKGENSLEAIYYTLELDGYRMGQKTIRFAVEIDADDIGATDQSYPDRTDQTYPSDTDLHITMPADVGISFVSYEQGYNWGEFIWGIDPWGWTGGDSDWVKYQGTVQKNFKYLVAKLVVDIASYTGIAYVPSFAVIIDVPEIEFDIQDITIPAGGKWIYYADYGYQLYAVPMIMVTVQSAGGNLVPDVSNKTNTSFYLTLWTPADISIAGVVDIKIKGY